MCFPPPKDMHLIARRIILISIRDALSMMARMTLSAMYILSYDGRIRQFLPESFIHNNSDNHYSSMRESPSAPYGRKSPFY